MRRRRRRAQERELALKYEQIVTSWSPEQLGRLEEGSVTETFTTEDGESLDIKIDGYRIPGVEGITVIVAVNYVDSLWGGDPSQYTACGRTHSEA